jgi:hypothetical protein
MVKGAQKLMGDNLKAVRANFSTLSWAVFVMSAISKHTQACPFLELKTRPRFCSVCFILCKLTINSQSVPSRLNDTEIERGLLLLKYSRNSNLKRY